MNFHQEIENPMIAPKPRCRPSNADAPCYSGVELCTQAERDAVNQRMIEENLRRMNAQMEANKRNEPIAKTA